MLEPPDSNYGGGDASSFALTPASHTFWKLYTPEGYVGCGRVQFLQFVSFVA